MCALVSASPPLLFTGPLVKPDLCHHLPAKHFLPAPGPEREMRRSRGRRFKPTNHSAPCKRRPLPPEYRRMQSAASASPPPIGRRRPPRPNWPRRLNMNAQGPAPPPPPPGARAGPAPPAPLRQPRSAPRAPGTAASSGRPGGGGRGGDGGGGGGGGVVVVGGDQFAFKQFAPVRQWR